MILDRFVHKHCKLFFIFILLVSLSSLAFAYFVEYVLGYLPCSLCLYQRVPYYLSIIISLLGLTYPTLERGWIKSLLTVLFVSLLLAGYHVGVESGVFKALQICKSEALDIGDQSIDEVRNMIYGNTKVSCEVPSFRLFNIPMSVMNMVWSLFLFSFTYLMYHRSNHAKTNFPKKS